MSKKAYRQYTKEFKLETLKLLESSEKSMTQIEQDLDITPGLLGKWKQRYKVDEITQELGPSDMEGLKKEIRRLARELAIAQEERDILKKAIGIFSGREKD